MSWTELLLDATRFDPAFSLSYGLDLRYLTLLHWFKELEKAGINVSKRPFPGYCAKNAVIKESAVLANFPKHIDANFCLRYGFDDYSYQALNYLSRLDMVLPKHFACKKSPLFLGNLAVCIPVDLQDIPVYPPSEMGMLARVEIPAGKTLRIIGFLGMHWVRDRIDLELLEQIDRIQAVFMQAEPMRLEFTTSQFPKQRYVQFYPKGRYYKIDEHIEKEIRLAYGYPEKGKTGFREKMLYDSACFIFGKDKVIRRYRGKELEGLELDVWIPEYKIGLEYQGEQHANHINHWHGENGFEAQIARDTRKRKLCKRLGYRLLLFKPRDDLDFVSLLHRIRKEFWI